MLTLQTRLERSAVIGCCGPARGGACGHYLHPYAAAAIGGTAGPPRPDTRGWWIGCIMWQANILAMAAALWVMLPTAHGRVFR